MRVTLPLLTCLIGASFAASDAGAKVIKSGTPLALGQYCTAVNGSTEGCLRLLIKFKQECEATPGMIFVAGRQDGTTNQNRCIRGQYADKECAAAFGKFLNFSQMRQHNHPQAKALYQWMSSGYCKRFLQTQARNARIRLPERRASDTPLSNEAISAALGVRADRASPAYRSQGARGGNRNRGGSNDAAGLRMGDVVTFGLAMGTYYANNPLLRPPARYLPRGVGRISGPTYQYRPGPRPRGSDITGLK